MKVFLFLPLLLVGGADALVRCVVETSGSYAECVAENCPAEADACTIQLPDDTCEDFQESCRVLTQECCAGQCGEELTRLLNCALPCPDFDSCGDSPQGEVPPAAAEPGLGECLFRTVETFTNCVVETCPAQADTCTEGQLPDDTCTEWQASCDTLTEECCSSCGGPMADLLNCVAPFCDPDFETCGSGGDITTPIGNETMGNETMGNETMPEPEPGRCLFDTTGAYSECVIENCGETADGCTIQLPDDTCDDFQESCRVLTQECCPACGEQLTDLLDCTLPCPPFSSCGDAPQGEIPGPPPEGESGLDNCLFDTVGAFSECVVSKCPDQADSCTLQLPDDTCDDFESSCKELIDQCCDACPTELTNLLNCVLPCDDIESCSPSGEPGPPATDAPGPPTTDPPSGPPGTTPAPETSAACSFAQAKKLMAAGLTGAAINMI